MLHNEDRELQIKLLDLQMQHQHDVGFLIAVLSLTISVGVSFSILCVTLAITLGQPNWAWIGIIGQVVLSCLALIAIILLVKRREETERQIQALKDEYIW